MMREEDDERLQRTEKDREKGEKIEEEEDVLKEVHTITKVACNGMTGLLMLTHP